MCHTTNALNQSKNGQLHYCDSCQLYHLTFSNFYLELNLEEFDHFTTFLSEIDVTYWETRYCSCTVRRKIPIPTLQRNLLLVLNPTELEELKQLLDFETSHTMNPIEVADIDYTIILN